MADVLSVSSLRKAYGGIVAVDGISFNVSKGEIVGLLGPNGAGKTTTINMILSVLKPTSGDIVIDGLDVAKNRTAALTRTNFAAVYAPLPGNLTVYENLKIFGMLYGVKDLEKRIETLLGEFDLVKFRDAKCGVLSSGEQTRASIAKAMLNKPNLLLLDEPTASLDPSKASEIRQLVRTFAQGDVGILWTSHNMNEVEEMCDRVLFMAHGKILLEGNPRTLPGEHGKASLEELFIAVAREPLSLGKTMQLNRVAAIALRQFYLIRGSVTRIVPLFIWVAIDIVLWGFITKFLNSVSQSATNFVPMMLGCVLLWDFLVRVMQGTTMAFMEDSWSRNFLNLFASPVRTSEYLSGLVISSICTSAVGLVVMIVLASAIFGLSFLSYGAAIAPFLLILFLFGIALGIFGCAVMLRLGPAAEWFVWPIPAIISPFACVFYPLNTLPHWMQVVSAALPPSYVFEGMRTIVAGGAVPLDNLLIGAGLAVFYILLGCWVFNRIYAYAVQTGLIARYSAETVS